MTMKRILLFVIVIILAVLRPTTTGVAQSPGKDQVLSDINAALKKADDAFYAKFKTEAEWTTNITDALVNYVAANELVNANLTSPDFAQEPDKTTLLTLEYRALAGKGRTQARQFQVMSTPYLFDNSGANIPGDLKTLTEADTLEARNNLQAAATLGESFAKPPAELEWVYTTWAAVLKPKLPKNVLFFTLKDMSDESQYMAYQLFDKALVLFRAQAAKPGDDNVYGALSDQAFIASDLSGSAFYAPGKQALGKTEVQWWKIEIERQRDQAAYLMSGGRSGYGYYNGEAQVYSQALQDGLLADPDGMTLTQWLQDQIKYGDPDPSRDSFQITAQERLAWLTQDTVLARTAVTNATQLDLYRQESQPLTPGLQKFENILFYHNLGKDFLLLNSPLQALGSLQAAKIVIDAAVGGQGISPTAGARGFPQSDLVKGQTRFENEWLVGRALVQLARYREALTYLQGLNALIPNYSTNVIYPASQYDLGQAYLGLNRFDTAIVPLENSRKGYQDQLTAATTAKDADLIRAARVGLIDATLTLSTPLAVLGRTEEAVVTLQQALDEANKQDDPTLKINTMLRVGDIYLQLEKDDDALRNYQAAADLAVSAKLPQQQGHALLGVGQILTKRGQIDDARKAITQASAAAKTANDSDGEVQALDALGDLALQGKPDAKAAQSFYTQALTVAVTSKDPRLPIQPLMLLGDVQASTAPATAQFTYYQSLSAALQIGDREAQARLFARIGALNAGQGDAFSADAAYRNAIQIIEQTQRGFKSESLTGQFAANYAPVYARYLKLLVDQKRYADAFNLSEQARARAFLDQLALGPVDYRQGASADLLQKTNDLRQQIDALRQLQIQTEADTQSTADAHKLALSQVEVSLQVAERQYNDLFTRLQAEAPQLSSLTSVQTLPLAQVQAALNPGTTLLSYYTLDTVTYAFIITHDNLTTVALPVGQTQLDQSVQLFRADEKQGQGLTDLSTAILMPLLDQLNQSKTAHIIVIPHNVLNYIPFAALPTSPSADSPLFGEKFVVSYLPSASSLAYLSKTPDQPGELFALGNPAADGQPPLQFAAQEVTQAVAIAGGEAFTGKDATVALLQQKASDAGTLYIAAHGTFNGRNPLFSALHLASTSNDSGLLEVYKIYSLDLTHKTQLVVLSACDTALGTLSAGDEFTGLNRAFLYAGAPAVIATLWSIDDKATGLLMKTFFQMRAKGQSTAQALQSAQAFMRTYQENGQTPYASPYYWAAFILTSATQS